MAETNDEQLSVEAAGRIVGISPRTLRTWIVHGKLPATGGRRGKVVKLADVIAAASEIQPNNVEVSDSPPPPEPLNGEVQPAIPAPNPVVDSLLAELRDGVIWPLAERLEVLANENGRLVAEREAAIRERDEIARQFGSDHRFIDRLVELLQTDLDEAHRRIQQLEADNQRLKERCGRAEAALHPAVRVLLRLRNFR